MKLHALKFGFAAAIMLSIIWTACVVLVLAFPSSMMSMSGDMMHLDLSSVDWSLSFLGFLVGLICWAAVSGVMAWLFATIYNRLL